MALGPRDRLGGCVRVSGGFRLDRQRQVDPGEPEPRRRFIEMRLRMAGVASQRHFPLLGELQKGHQHIGYSKMGLLSERRFKLCTVRRRGVVSLTRQRESVLHWPCQHAGDGPSPGFGLAHVSRGSSGVAPRHRATLRQRCAPQVPRSGGKSLLRFAMILRRSKCEASISLLAASCVFRLSRPVELAESAANPRHDKCPHPRQHPRV